MGRRRRTQKDNILAHLKQYGMITPLDALKQYGCFRLGAIIHTLRHEGQMDIINLNKTGEVRYARYKLKKEPKQESMFEDEKPKYGNPYEGGY